MAMGRNIKLRDLSKTVLMDQLKLCWKHFRACAQALDGDDKVFPVELMECDGLGDCDDLDLFYKCKRAGERLANIDAVKTVGNGTGE